MPEIIGMKTDLSNLTTLPGLLETESVSAFAYGNARGMASMAAYMAGKGTLNGKQLLTRDSFEALHANPEIGPLLAGFGRTNFTQGGVNLFSLERGKDTIEHPKMKFKHQNALYEAVNGMRKDYYGWMGLGGSIMQWQPELEIGISYVPFELYIPDINNLRSV